MTAAELFQYLNQLEAGADHEQNYLINRADVDYRAQTQQLARQIYQAFLDPKWQLTDVLYFGLALHKHKLQAIFELAGGDERDACLKKCIQQFNRQKKAKLTDKTRQILMKILLLIGFHHQFEFDPWYFLAIDKSLGIEAVLGMLAKRRLLLPEEEAKFEAFVSRLSCIQHWPLHDHSPVVIGQAWYQAAYDKANIKYDLIKQLNQLSQRWLQAHAVPLENRDIAKSDGNSMLVILEQFKSDHAMYRCFANGIKALKKQHHLIAVAEPGSVDDTALALFDDFIPVQFKTPTDIKSLAQRLSAAHPECVYFTSIGMKYWSVLLANMRLAKTQIATAGHPISACSDKIDAMILEDHKCLEDIHFEETVVGIPSGTFGFVLPEHHMPEKAVRTESVINIALPASVYKLNADFLALCQRIQAKAKKSIAFHSFSGCRGLEYHQLSDKLRQCLDNSFIYPSLSYDAYLQQLAQCDLYLAPFPFGGTNSTIDCLLLSVPSIALAYPDLAAADSFILRQAGFGECVVDSIEAYEALALALIADDDKRLAIEDKMTKLDANLNGLLGEAASGDAYQLAIDYAMSQSLSQQDQKPRFIASDLACANLSSP